MARNLLNFVTDLATAVAMLGMVATGLVIRFVLPPGSGNTRSLWALGRHDWGDLHFWLAVATAGVLLVHVALHWNWVCTTALRLCRVTPGSASRAHPLRRNLAGIGTVVLLIAGFWGFVRVGQSSVSSAGGPLRSAGRTSSAETGEEIFIRGSTTLEEAAAAGNMTVAELCTAMGLPTATPPHEQMGRLGREHGIAMSQMRLILNANRKQPTTQAEQP